MIQKIRHKSRLVVMNDDTFEEQFSMVLSPLNVFAWGGLFLLVFSLVLTLIIAFTPLRELIPGYADVNTRKLATYAAIRTDSVEQALKQNQVYIQNIQAILEGSDGVVGDTVIETQKPNLDQIDFSTSFEDSIMRLTVEEEERFNINSQTEKVDELATILLFPPLKGLVSSKFEPSIKHYGIDVVPASPDASVSAAYDGVVIQASWTSAEGHVIYVQHTGDLVSVYKHNSVLLKKTGDQVKAGEAIAIVGNSGELTSGPHLHFELWHKGNPVDPENYMVF